MKKWIMARAPILAIAAAIISVAAHAQRSDTTDPLVRPSLEAELAELKAKTAAMVATALPRLAALSSQERLAAAPEIWRVPGAVTEFKDCASCPHMMIVPAGEFTMGSPPAEQQAEAQHRVTIAAPFAVSKFEITFEDWNACVSDGGCDSARPNDEGWGRGRHPMIHMSFDLARTYVTWLSRKTGKTYRLLTEAEFEYAARAGTQTVYPWGDEIGKNNANCFDCGSQWSNRQTAPVGSFAANGFGLHDMVGNVFELVEDCYHPDYEGAPTDGSAWTTGCPEERRRVIRGGSWNRNSSVLRSAKRNMTNTVDRYGGSGFRVGRTLAP